jgi:hypothetical protein
MTVIPELRRELRATAERERRRRRRRRLLGLAPVLVVGGTTAALAAGGVIRFGEPATDPPMYPRGAADTGTGTVPRGSERLLAVRVADPDGGPPWGLQLAATTRGLGCLTPGRVAGGRIGALGQDGAFGDDGRLHPYASDITRRQCLLLDGGGRLFFNTSIDRMPANASLLAPCAPQQSTPCADGPERTLVYGLLGPGAESVTYRTPTGERTIKTTGPEGAYLLVLPAAPDEYVDGHPGLYPTDGRIVSIRFRDGRACDSDALRAAACRLPGFTPLRPKPLTQEQVSAKVTATARQGRRFWNMTVRFRAPVAIRDATAAYSAKLNPPGRSGRGASAFTRRNIKAGERVTFRFLHRNGGGTYKLRVTYSQATNPAQVDPTGPNELTVGRERITLP